MNRRFSQGAARATKGPRVHERRDISRLATLSSNARATRGSVHAKRLADDVAFDVDRIPEAAEGPAAEVFDATAPSMAEM